MVPGRSLTHCAYSEVGAVALLPHRGMCRVTGSRCEAVSTMSDAHGEPNSCQHQSQHHVSSPNPRSGSSPSRGGGRRAECRLEGAQEKAGACAVLAVVASEAGREEGPERPGHFPRQEARPVGASESLLLICTVLAPRIPGSTTQAACWPSPRGARGRFWQLWQHQIPVTQACVHWDAKPSLGGQDASPTPTPRCQQGLGLTSYLTRAEVVPQPYERFGAESNTLAM